MVSPSRSRERAKSAGVHDVVIPAVERRDEAKADASVVAVTAATEAEAGETPTVVRAIEAPVIEPGTDSDDEFDLASDLLGDDTTASLSSSIYAAYAYERGRRYQAFGDGPYPIPNDDLEQNREDMKHAMLMMLTDGQPFFAPIGTHPQKILDIGTGTGGLPLFLVTP